MAILGSRRDDDLAGDGWGAGGERRRIVFKDRATPNFAADWKMRRKGRSQEEESDWGVWGEGGGGGKTNLLRGPAPESGKKNYGQRLRF